jgi:microcompartment protein CcmK/EutM
MLLARVEGSVIATRKHPSYEGWRLLICQPINGAGEPEGVPQIAVDPHGAGMHERVLISSDGMATRLAVGDPKSPARWMIIALVDEPELAGESPTRALTAATRLKPPVTPS